MNKLLLLLVLSLFTGCATYYPVGSTPMEQWQIDRYYEDRNRQIGDSFLPAPRQYCNRQYCW